MVGSGQRCTAAFGAQEMSQWGAVWRPAALGRRAGSWPHAGQFPWYRDVHALSRPGGITEDMVGRMHLGASWGQGTAGQTQARPFPSV